MISIFVYHTFWGKQSLSSEQHGHCDLQQQINREVGNILQGPTHSQRLFPKVFNFHSYIFRAYCLHNFVVNKLTLIMVQQQPCSPKTTIYVALLEIFKQFCLVFSCRGCWWKTATLFWNFVPEVHEVLCDPVMLIQHKGSLPSAGSSSQRLAEQNPPQLTRPCYLPFQTFTVSSAFISALISSGEGLSARWRLTELKSEEFSLSLAPPRHHPTLPWHSPWTF